MEAAGAPVGCWEAESIDVWAARVAAAARLPDQRLNTRLATTLKTLAAHPHDHIPQAAGNAANAKGIYRFLENQRIAYRDLVCPLAYVTARNCVAMPKVFLVQDSTSLNYSRLNATRGLGPLNDSSRARGLHLHTTLAVDGHAIVRGVIDLRVWARPLGQRTRQQRKARRIEDKESFKWIAGVRAGRAVFAEALPSESRPPLIHVMDREGDIHEVFQEILAHGEGALIRCAQNRSIDGEIDRAHQAVAASSSWGTMTLRVPAKEQPPPRDATLEVRVATVMLKPDPKKHRGRQPLTLTLIEARENGAPADVPPLHWRLWTTEPVRTTDDAVTLIHTYALRWRVEDYHLTLKSGCAVEELQLETADRLAKAVAVYAVVAARIVSLRDLGRHAPQTPCTCVLTDEEWRVLTLHVEHRLPQADEAPPTIRTAMLWIGRLGGHLGRKHDGLPGVRTLWRGWRDLALLVLGYRASQCTAGGYRLRR
jgi:hypothetical protein